MARIAGVNIPQNKVLCVALTYIHGIGDKFSRDICEKLKIENPSTLRKQEILFAILKKLAQKNEQILFFPVFLY